MADKTHIEWTEATWNPVTGCSKVSAGCKHCYAEREWARLSANPKTRYHGRSFNEVQYHSDVLELPLHWKRPRRIFVNSMSDLFHGAVPDRFIADVFGIMAATPWHTYQVLTKRPQRMRDLLRAGCMGRFEADAEECAALYTDQWPLDWPLKNVWLGVSVEDQETADERIPILLDTPAWTRWVSAEPLLGPVDILGYLDGLAVNADISRPNVDWVVAGGESGANARPMHPQWARSLRDQCTAADAPFLLKQWGEWSPLRWGTLVAPEPDLHAFGDGQAMIKVGKKTAGRLLDGKLHDDYPIEVPF